MTNAKNPDEKTYTFVITRFESASNLIDYGVKLHTSNIDGITLDNYEYYTNLPKDEEKQLKSVFEKNGRALLTIFDDNPALKKIALEVKVKSSEIKEK